MVSYGHSDHRPRKIAGDVSLARISTHADASGHSLERAHRNDVNTLISSARSTRFMRQSSMSPIEPEQSIGLAPELCRQCLQLRSNS